MGGSTEHVRLVEHHVAQMAGQAKETIALPMPPIHREASTHAAASSSVVGSLHSAEGAEGYTVQHRTVGPRSP